MDEQTPHLHIDFIPFTTGSKRGLETRVSLKQALKSQGFNGGSRSETEWNQWVNAEKMEVAKIMNKYEVKWVNLDTHNKPLDVLNFKKEKRKEEISKLDHEILTLKKQYNSLQNMTPYLNDAFNALNNEELWLLPEPNKLTLASTYHKNIVQPKFSKLRAFIQPLINQVFDIVKELINLKTQLIFLKSENTELKNSIDELSYENRELKRDMNKLKKFFGKDTIENALTFKIVKSKRKEIHK